ncbi:MAG: TonB family protein [bacterium]|nr:TonB family protein [bacterium]
MKKHPKVSLKRKSRKILETCIVLSISIHIILFFMFMRFEAESVLFEQVDAKIQIQDIPETEQIKRPLPPQSPAVPIESEDEELLDDVTIDETDINFANFDSLPAPPKPVVEQDEIPPFLPLENQPKIIGGTKALYKELKYPPTAEKAQIEGRVVIKFIVGVDGVPRDFEVIKSRHSALDQAAIDAIKKLRFIPATQRDNKVPYPMILPVLFKIGG